MSDVQRYAIAQSASVEQVMVGLVPDDHGDVVKYDDHKDEIARLEKEIERLQEMPRYSQTPTQDHIVRRCENCNALVEIHKKLCLVQITNCRACKAEDERDQLRAELEGLRGDMNQTVGAWIRKSLEHEQQRDQALARVGVLEAILHDAKDCVLECVNENKQKWGESLMHKQQPDIDLYKNIQAALGEGKS